MSLIERALGRVKGGAAPAAVPADAAPAVGTLQQPVPPRRAVDPQLRFTPEIRQDLGIDGPEQFRHQRTSEYRHIKRYLLGRLRNGEAGSRVILVTSALAGEGKSFNSANLAQSLAMEPDYSVLLLDADVVKPALSRALTLIEQPGLMDALLDPALDVESLVVTTDVDGLSVLPAGGRQENATELLSSERMVAIVERLLAVPNRILLIDSLPLLLTTESRALVRIAQEVLLVVRAESTPQAAVRQAVELLGDEVEVKVVLNAVVRTKLANYLGYGYGYGYEYSYADKNARRKADP
jgi:exopolysaccharide/PEP-CTERM locus tyrosine autokinase